MVRKLNIYFHTMEATGHINACLGLAQELYKRGHDITFLVSKAYDGFFNKYGFSEIILKKKELSEEAKKENKGEDPVKFMANRLLEWGVLSNKSAIEKSKIVGEVGVKVFEESLENVSEFHDQMKQAIEDGKPDVILVEHFVVPPCIMMGDVPWVFVFSCNPVSLFESDELPPFKSGLPINDRSQWEEFKKVDQKMFSRQFKRKQIELLKKFGYGDVDFKETWPLSKYLNIYGFPEELDYDDVVPIPDKHCRVDSYFRHEPQAFELPEEFRRKIKPTDKLVFFSMGSMGSIDVDLLRKVVNALKDTPHKYIVSKGPRHDELELPENMYGERYLPQTSILPMVDLVITHGGNNTMSEAFFCGKPMIVMPLFVDQFDNAQRIVDKKFGIRLEPYAFKDQELVDAVNKLLFDEDLKQRLEKVKTRMQQTNSKAKACEQIENLVKS